MANFFYKDLSKAEFDLKLFSRMNLNEGRALFLLCGADGMSIEREQPDATHLITAIAIDGILFSPSK